jgi:L-lysine exporter family protein LysE/ArgO
MAESPYVAMVTFLIAAVSGFLAGASLIVAIGAQNAFVLRSGIVRSHVLAIVIICAASDAILIALGVAGTGALVRAAPFALRILTWVGAAFLFGYAVFAARRALRPGKLDAADKPVGSLAAAIATCLALTWLNPHVYLDTVLLLGSISSGHGPIGRWWFGLGAALASVAWFSALGFGARLLAPVFAKPLAWRVLDAIIAAVMVALGVLLLVSH